MPYVITAKRPKELPHFAELVASRSAVATLDEARNAGVEVVVAHGGADFERFLPDADTLPEAGGTVGPLPDGTLIEVEQVTWNEMATLSPKSGAQGTTDLLAAYNAQHAPALNH